MSKSKNIKYIIIILGEPFSTFNEIIGKYFYNFKKYKKNIIIIGNKQLLNDHLKKLRYNLKINDINNLSEAKKNYINIINIKFKYKKIFDKISNRSNEYIKNCFNEFFHITKNKRNFVLINGPVSKKTFLKRRFPGITEYLAKKTNSSNEVMLIYNEKFSVSPLTTHIPIKHVVKKISKEKIIKNVLKIHKFYKSKLKKNPKFAILGLNPHCESIDKVSEENEIIIPSIKKLKKIGINTNGPFSADTFFQKKNLDKFDVAIGMYHDQVLTPIKTLYNFDAINLTIGLPFIRISPDHGPNSEMLGRNLSDSSSLKHAMKFIEKLK